MEKNTNRLKTYIAFLFIRPQTWTRKGFQCGHDASSELNCIWNQIKGSCDDQLFESRIRCVRGYFICRSDRFVYKDNQLVGTDLLGTIELRMLPLDRLKSICPNGLDSPINSEEVQFLALKPGTGILKI